MRHYGLYALGIINGDSLKLEADGRTATKATNNALKLSPFDLLSGGPEPQEHLQISTTSVRWTGADRLRPEHVRWQIHGGVQRGRIQAKSGAYNFNICQQRGQALG